jgi:hypothetical protein
MTKRMQHCFNCGEQLGIFDSWPGDLDICGKIECQREQTYAYRCRDAEAQEAAREDGYDRTS